MSRVVSDGETLGLEGASMTAPSLHSARSLLLWRRVLPRSTLRMAAALGVLLGLTLALGACTKCDVPNWTAPHACHEGPAAY
jgi:hypothetical protein